LWCGVLAVALLVAGAVAVARTPWTSAAAAAAGTSAPGAPATPSSAPSAAPAKRVASAQPDPTAQYPAVSARLVAMLRSSGARTALRELQRLVTADADVATFCHALAHDLGHAALEANGGNLSRTVALRDDVCGGGFLHGALEHAISGSADPERAVVTLCAPRYEGSCLHGAGHGAMFATDLDLRAAVRLCDRLGSEVRRARCGEGVFMQLFSSTTRYTHPIEALRDSEPRALCAAQPVPYRSACWFYAPSHYLAERPGNYRGALAWCAEVADATAARTCTRGVGSRAMKYLIDREQQAEAQCHTGLAWQRDPCVRGMTSYYGVHHHGLRSRSQLCGELTDARDRQSCRAVARGSSSAD
jgi:hypothetical protein